MNNSGKKTFQDGEIYEHNACRPCSLQETSNKCVKFYSGKTGFNTLLHRSSLQWAGSSEMDIMAISSYHKMIISIYKTLKNGIVFRT